jgi:hypothetical protein
MARSIRLALVWGLGLSILAGCAAPASRQVAGGAEPGWSACEPTTRALLLVCVKR